MRIVLGSALLAGALPGPGPARAAATVPFPVARAGRPAATRAAAAKAGAAATCAAAEVQDHIRRITGATLPIRTDAVPVEGPRILVGESAGTRALGLPGKPFRAQEYLVRALPRAGKRAETLVLMGKDAAPSAGGMWPQRVPGRFGSAVRFEGAQVVVVPDCGFDDGVGTLEAWVWVPAARSNRHGTILRMDGADPWTYHILQRDANSDRISYTAYDGKNGHGVGADVKEGWHHLVATHDARAGKMELFIDGASVGSTTYVKTTCKGVPLGIGAYAASAAPGNPFHGLIDEVRVSRVLRAPASAGPPTADADTTLLYHFDESEGAPVDAAGSGTANLPLPGLFEEHGTLAAAYHFLERCCDVRWYAPGEVGVVCPSSPTLTVRVPEVRRAPAWEHRWITPTPLYLPGPPDRVPARDVEVWKLRMGIGGRPFWVCHSFEGYYDRFLAQHPDWFAQGYTGRPPQMCYTNEEFVRQVIQDARDYFDGKGARPGAAAMGDVFGLVPMDNNSWCKCPRCQAEINKAEAGNPQFNNGKASDYIFRFVNEVAREVKKTHPDKWIGALAYSDYAYYPAGFQVEPNVFMQLCLHTRNWWCPSMERNDLKVLSAWRGREPRRPIYLWLYYNFPALNAQYGAFHYFPGFFAHTVVSQMRRYRAAGISGVFMEHSSEFGQTYLMDQLEFYVTLKMAQDASLDGNRLIEEFFTRYYGAAAAPMKALYGRIEQTFSDPKGYPVEIRQSPAHQHQTEALAWVSLGTEERMREFAGLMAQARAAARTPLEKQRVALFEKGIWEYVAEGRSLYASRLKQRAMAPPQVRVPHLSAAGGDPNKVDWSRAVAVGKWSTVSGDATGRKVETRVAHDGTHLYVCLSEELDPARLLSTGMIYDGDDWEIFFASRRGADARRQVCIAPNGKHVATAFGEKDDRWNSGAVVASETAGGRWTVRVALPLAQVVPGGAKPGAPLFANFYRASPGASDLLAWSPNFAGSFHDTTRLGELTLE